MTKSIQTILLVISLLLIFHVIYSQDNNWTSVGPEGGYVEKVKTAPSEKNIIYCGMKDGSVFRSDRSGSNWALIGWFSEGISNLEVHPYDSKIIYLGTNTNLYITTNGGSVWQNTGWSGGGINSLTIDQVEPQKIYLSSFGNYGGIWKSENAGVNWTFLAFPDNLGMTFAICVDPISNNIIYAVSNSWKMYRSTNYGELWDIISEITGYPIDLAIDPSNTNILYLASSEGIFKSTDNGFSWYEKNNGDIDRDHPWTENVIIDPTNTNHIYRTNNHNWSTFISTNQGESWKAIDLPAGSLTISSDSIVLSGTRDGIYAWNKSSNTIGFSSEGLYGTTIKSIQVSSQFAPIIFAATEDQGIAKAYLYKFQEGLNDWQKYFWGSGISEIKVSPFNPQIIIGGFNDGISGLNMSSDGGDSWQIKSLDERVHAIEFSSNNPSVIFAGGLNGFHKSNDLGDGWTKIILPNNYHTIDHMSVGKNDSLIFLGLDRGIDWDRKRTLLSSTDSGETWYDYNISSNSVLIVPNFPNIILCGTSSTLFRSTDSGLTWYQINVVDESIYIHSIKCYKNKLIFIGTNQGVFYSNDAGLSWLKLGDDLLHNNVLDISFTEVPIPSIIIGTQGGGVYKKNIDCITNIDKEVLSNKSYELSNNYPNPFNASTIINYTIPNQSHVLIKIFDILCREIKILVNEIKSEGNYKLHIELNELPSSVYFVKMISGNFYETRKIILMK